MGVDAITVLQKEVAVQHEIKRYFALTLTFRKAASLDVIIDSPIVYYTLNQNGVNGNQLQRRIK